MQSLSLAGEWRLFRGAEKTAIPAAVPGDSLSALVAAGKVPDPYHGMNELDLQWLGSTDWTYVRSFEADAALLNAASVILRLDGVDTVATVSINGKRVGCTENMFRRYDLDVKKALKAGVNEIAICIEAPESAAARRQRVLPYPVPHGINPVQSMNRNLLRKVQCHAGWDWGPCLMVSGIYGGITLMAAYQVRIDYVMTEVVFKGAAADVAVIIEADVFGGGPVPLRITLGDAMVEKTVTPGSGRQTLRETIRVKNVRRWWPNGFGEQFRYDLSVRLGEAVCEKKIGLREIQLINQEDKNGLSMTFRVNGVDIFCKGANWIPADAMPQRQTPALYEDLLQSAADANMNMLRVWGGGQYEQDAFYDLCDAKGLMVWQDFMFSCALYPADKEFLANVREEVIHQVKRLRDHACIAIWCGNNENLAALKWYQESRDSRDRYLVDYDRLYEGTIGAAVDAADPTRTYWPCSPCAGRGDYSDCFHDDSRGDMHYWEVWHGGKPFSAYYGKVPRFCSEFGYQSFPSMEVIRTYADEDQFNLTAPVMEHHQRNRGGNSRIIEMFSRYFRMPNGFRNFVYLSQVQQGVAIRTAVEYWRSLRPVCMGTLFWQINDCWPVCSWASLNYGGKWKILHYMAKRFYAPVMLTVFRRADDAPVEIWGVNDRLEARAGTMSARLYDFAGNILWKDEKRISLAANGAKKLAEYAVTKMTSLAPTEVFLVVELTTGEGTVRNDLFLTEYKRCRLPDADVRVAAVTRTDSGFEVSLASTAAAFFVTADAEGIAGEFDDNAFTMLGGETRTLRFTPKQAVTVAVLRKAIRVNHLAAVSR